jgi:hypothetical protein
VAEAFTEAVRPRRTAVARQRHPPGK